jgi:CubicO group peptidase (beta-lactamase class C family)
VIAPRLRTPILLLACCIALVAPSPKPAADTNAAALARTLFAQSQAGKIDPALLGARLRAALTPALQRQAAKGLGRLGPPTAMTLIASRPLTTVKGVGSEFQFSFAHAPPLNFFVAAAPDGKVVGLFFFPAPSLSHLAPTAFVDAIRAHVRHEATTGHFSGVVLLAKNGAAVYRQAYGMADRERRIPNTLETKFRIGSMNKMFTAVALLQLAQAGRISLGAPIGRYIPGYPNAQVASSVTVEQLLTHTGEPATFLVRNSTSTGSSFAR